MMLMLNVPATIGLMVLSLPIVELIYERGAFLSRDTAATAAGADVLRAGPARLLRGQDRVADFLLACVTAAHRCWSAS